MANLSIEARREAKRQRQLEERRQVEEMRAQRRRDARERLLERRRAALRAAVPAARQFYAAHKLLAYDGLINMCNHYERRLQDQHDTMRRMEHKCFINKDMERRGSGLG